MNIKDVFTVNVKLHGEDADPYVGGNVIAVADGLGGSGSTVHKVGSAKEWKNGENEDGGKIYEELLDSAFDFDLPERDNERNEFIGYLNNMSKPMIDETDDTSAAWASRIVIARFIYALRFGKFSDKDTDLENEGTRAELADYITKGLRKTAEKFGLKKGALDQQLLLPTTLAAIKFTELRDRVIAETVWSGDSRCYALTPEFGLQVLSADDEDSSGSINNLFYVGDKNGKTAVLNYARHEIKKPCVLLAVSDGMFDPFGGDGHSGLEATLLTHLSDSDTAEECGKKLGETFEKMRYDDTTAAFVPFGFGAIKERISDDGALGGVADLKQAEEKVKQSLIDLSASQDALFNKSQNNSIKKDSGLDGDSDSVFDDIKSKFKDRTAYAEKLWNDLCNNDALLDMLDISPDEAAEYVVARTGDKLDSIISDLVQIDDNNEHDVALTEYMRKLFHAVKAEVDNNIKNMVAESVIEKAKVLLACYCNGSDEGSAVFLPTPKINTYVNEIKSAHNVIRRCSDKITELENKLSERNKLQQEETRFDQQKDNIKQYIKQKRKETDEEYDKILPIDKNQAIKISQINEAWQNLLATFEHTDFAKISSLRGLIGDTNKLCDETFVNEFNSWLTDYLKIKKALSILKTQNKIKGDIEKEKACKSRKEADLSNLFDKLVYRIKALIKADTANINNIFTPQAIAKYGLDVPHPTGERKAEFIKSRITDAVAAQRETIVNEIVGAMSKHPKETSKIDARYNRSQLDKFRLYFDTKSDAELQKKLNGLREELIRYNECCTALFDKDSADSGEILPLCDKPHGDANVDSSDGQLKPKIYVGYINKMPVSKRPDRNRTLNRKKAKLHS